MLKKVAADYDPQRPARRHELSAAPCRVGQVVTGLLYVDPEPEDLHRISTRWTRRSMRSPRRSSARLDGARKDQRQSALIGQSFQLRLFGGGFLHRLDEFRRRRLIRRSQGPARFQSRLRLEMIFGQPISPPLSSRAARPTMRFRDREFRCLAEGRFKTIRALLLVHRHPSNRQTRDGDGQPMATARADKANEALMSSCTNCRGARADHRGHPSTAECEREHRDYALAISAAVNSHWHTPSRGISVTDSHRLFRRDFRPAAFAICPSLHYLAGN